MAMSSCENRLQFIFLAKWRTFPNRVDPLPRTFFASIRAGHATRHVPIRLELQPSVTDLLTINRSPRRPKIAARFQLDLSTRHKQAMYYKAADKVSNTI